MKNKTISHVIIPVFVLLLTTQVMSGLYKEPKTEKAENGYEAYCDPILIDKNNAGAITIGAFNYPEAPVIYFYISKILDNNKYKKALAPEESYTEREKNKLKVKLERMSRWKFLEFKLVKRYKDSESGYWIKIYLKVSINGKVDSGTDDTEVIYVNGKWYLKMPPT